MSWRGGRRCGRWCCSREARRCLVVLRPITRAEGCREKNMHVTEIPAQESAVTLGLWRRHIRRSSSRASRLKTAKHAFKQAGDRRRLGHLAAQTSPAAPLPPSVDGRQYLCRSHNIVYVDQSTTCARATGHVVALNRSSASTQTTTQHDHGQRTGTNNRPQVKSRFRGGDLHRHISHGRNPESSSTQRKPSPNRS